MFFDEVLLFEDELHDHGVSMLSVKIVSFCQKHFYCSDLEAEFPTPTLLEILMQGAWTMIRMIIIQSFHKKNSWFPIPWISMYSFYIFIIVLPVINVC